MVRRRSTNAAAAAFCVVVFAAALSPDVAHADAQADRPLWYAYYDGPTTDVDHAQASAYTPDGAEVIVTGDSTGRGGDTDYATVAYDASTGKKLWASRADHGGAPDIPNALVVDPAGTTVYVTGESDLDYYTVAYDVHTGAKLWAARYDGPAGLEDDPSAIAVTPDGSAVIVTGASGGYVPGDDDTEYATVAYDATTGHKRWTALYDGPSESTDSAMALAVSPSGSSVVVTGGTYASGSSSDTVTISYDVATGHKEWLSSVAGGRLLSIGGGDTVAFGVDGTYVYVGGTGGSSFDGDYLVAQYTAATGAPGWSQTFDGPTHENDVVDELVVTPDGSAVVATGRSQTSGSPTYAAVTIAYNAASGAKAWLRTFPPSGSDSAFVVYLAHIPGSSSVLVTGNLGFGPQFAIAYSETTGKPLWKRLPTAWPMFVDPVAVRPDGSSYVMSGAGGSPVDGHHEFLTVAFPIP